MAQGTVKKRYRRHSLPVRIMHWVNVVTLALMLGSGLQIFNAHPSLYWGKSSYDGTGAWLKLDRFPSWVTLPSEQWLSAGRQWHFFFAWVLVINGLGYLAYSFASRHFSKDLVPDSRQLRGIGQSIRDHLRFRHPQGVEALRYNVLQKLSYLFVIFMLLPFMVLTGLAMSPRLNSFLTGWVDLLGGRQSARTLHFCAAALLVAFVLVHVFEVVVSGVWNNLRAMITGRYDVAESAGEPPREQ
ncbi:MAG: cytochrome b/b6 domain-containing protein [Steroidobacteraceae bacterium]